MTWTWDEDQLDTSQLMQVRSEVADTDINNQLLSDQQINYYGTVETNFWGCAARCSEVIARGFLRKADIKLGRAMQITYSKMAEQYFLMAKVLRAKALGSQVPWVGGMSIADKLIFLQNSDIYPSIFVKHMQENPWTGGYSPDAIWPGSTDPNGLDEEML